MKLYLSSYKFGDNPQQLADLFGSNKKVAVITNALDQYSDLERRSNGEQEQVSGLKDLGLEGILVDLRKYFGKEGELKSLMETFGGAWVHGGNAFVLRVAYKLSGLDKIIQSYSKDPSKKNFVYAGFSAGCCILQQSMRGIEFVDPPEAVKETYNHEVVWEGLGIIDYVFVPHFESDHPESEATSVEVEYYKKNNIPYKTLHDGEVIISET